MISFDGKTIDLSDSIDISLPISPDLPISAFGMQAAQERVLLEPKTDEPKGCRCSQLTIIPHVHTTHFETAQHYGDQKVSSLMIARSIPPLLTCLTIHVEWTPAGPIKFSTPNVRNGNVAAVLLCSGWIKHQIQQKAYDWTGFNPPYVSVEMMEQIQRAFPRIRLLLLDLPSVDPEDDGGRLLAHRAFLKQENRGLIEMCLVDRQLIQDNTIYALFPNIAAIDTDGIPYSCIFCKIIRGAIPSYKILDTPLVYAFLDIGPLSEGHILVIPKHHAVRMHELPDEHLQALLPAAKKIVNALAEDGTIPDYNILQNNGPLAHQEVQHVHFHLIPKRSHLEGLGITWSTIKVSKERLGEIAEKIVQQLK